MGVMEVEEGGFPRGDKSGIRAAELPRSGGVPCGDSLLDEVELTVAVGDDIAHFHGAPDLVEFPARITGDGWQEGKPECLRNAGGRLAEPLEVEGERPAGSRGDEGADFGGCPEEFRGLGGEGGFHQHAGVVVGSLVEVGFGEGSFGDQVQPPRLDERADWLDQVQGK